MLKKRIIPCLDIQNGRVVKGVQFLGLRDAGDPLELAAKYETEGADELIFLDITAGIERRVMLLPLVRLLASNLSIPFTVGGGIKTLDDAKQVFDNGADKISINSAAYRNPSLISEIANRFGSQAVVVAVDAKKTNEGWMVALDGGRTITDRKVLNWCLEAQKMGAGEILLTSMEGDGSKEGFSIDLLKEISSSLNIPVIASGGAGKKEHFLDVFKKTDSGAALAASLFHFDELGIPELKNYLNDNQVEIRL
jgi:imidazole glycerol-phosphate synthase subunit HisF